MGLYYRDLDSRSRKDEVPVGEFGKKTRSTKGFDNA